MDMASAQAGLVDWKGNPINKEKHGGVRATWFIYFMVAITSMVFASNVFNMVTYLTTTMHMDVTKASTSVTNLIGGTCAFALIGGFISDSYFTRFKTILIFAPLGFLGYGLLALQAHLKSLRPSECNIMLSNSCQTIHGSNAALLYFALYITALGEGCLRANLAPFGGDQFDDEDLVELRQKSSFFNWFGFSISVGSLIGLIFIVWIQNNKGWDIAFTVSAGLILLGLTVIASGFTSYRYQIPRGSPLTRMLQVFVAAFQKRKLTLPENEEEMHLENGKEEKSEELSHTKGFKWLDKASISYGSLENSNSCTVSQVEETKIALRMLPIFISAMIGYIPIPLLLTFTVQQGSIMDNKVGKIRVPPASLLVIPIALQTVILVVYDRFFVPLARKFTGIETGITPLQRVGVGFISTSLACCIGAIIEMKRKGIAERNGLLDSKNQIPMSIMWLGLQFLVIGINDVTTFVGLLEFFNTEASKGMKSLGTAIFWCNIGLGSLLGSVLVNVVNKATKHRGIGWLEGNNLNRSYLDRFYWLLCILGCLAFLNYLYWARRYRYRQQNRSSY